ncbi:MAG: type II toxin-antitoxin system prevent-host-death family antitoxin [Bryobacteraceae bacterium]|nr:type II toxin-antitoxin system prevent-host-death family antitoxin [Bryobacteraceae bacterium]
MSISTIHEAKTQLSRLIERAERGEEVVIARGKTPVVRLVPVGPAPKERKPGLFAGQFTVTDAFFEPLPPEELDAWE